MRLKTALTSPGPSMMRSFSNNSSSSNSVIMHHHSNKQQQQHHSSPVLFDNNNDFNTLETSIYKQRYNIDDDYVDGEEEEEANGSNFLDMDDDEADIERLLDNLPPSPPSSPPRELLPDRLYALYDFEGPDPNHLQLERNDAVELLNDEDNYWWLVKNLQSSKVGFVPLEFLENFEERLARLNCWKNEQHEKSSKQDLIDNLDEEHLILVNGDKLIDFNKVELKDKRQKVSFDIKEDFATTRSEILSEVYSDYTPLVINKKEPLYLSNQNFLVKSLDDYEGIVPMVAPPTQQIFKEDSIGSFSSDTDTSPNSNTSNRIRFQPEQQSNLDNSIQLLDDYIKGQTLIEDTKVDTKVQEEEEEDEDNTLRDDDDDESLTSSNNSLLRNQTTTPLTSESYLNNDSFSMKTVVVASVDAKQLKYHPFVHELFDDLMKEIETLSSCIQNHL